MVELPTGTVTFLLTDVEGSTALWEEAPVAMRAALARHDALFETAVAQHGGAHIRPRGEGDSRFAVFSSASQALTAALAIQRAFAAEPWPTPRPIKVRIGLHTGEVERRDGDYFGSAVNRCARVRNMAHGGQVLLSEATAALGRDGLPADADLRDLGLHRLRGLSRAERVFQLTTPDLASAPPPLDPAGQHPNNLPLQTTALVGREREAARTRDLLLEADVRLVTLTGPGGIGKTRLALQVAADLLESVPDGVFFVELAPIADPALIASTIGTVVGLAERCDRPLDDLKRFLAQRSLLLVLDNFEQILAGASVVTELLAASAGLKVLVTSRAPLRVRGEHELDVPSLALPDPDQEIRPDALHQYSGIVLFVERARAVRADFALTDENGRAVATICARLDGLPLALELAATRVRLLPPDAMVRRLERRLPLLTGGARDLPERQRTLRDTIAWSYDLLDEAEQRVFRALAVFVGGFTLEAAEAVVGGGTDVDILDAVSRLVTQSLVRPVDGTSDESRYGMLETVREFGLSELEARGEADEIRQRHLAWCQALLERYWKETTARGSPLTAWTDRFQDEHDNFRSALSWSLAHAEVAELGACIAGVLGTHFWSARGHQYEGRAWLERFLASVTARSWGRAMALEAAAYLAMRQRDYALAAPRFEEALEIFRELDDRREIARTLRHYGILPTELGQFERAQALLEESASILRSLGDLSGVSMTLHNLGDLASDRGDEVRARAAYQESVALGQQVGNRHATAYALRGLGHLARTRGEFGQAVKYLRESLTLLRPLRDVRCTPLSLEGLACITAGPGWAERAARLLGAAQAMQARTGTPSPPSAMADYERTVADARAALGEARFDATWKAGGGMSLGEAVAYALSAEAASAAPDPAVLVDERQAATTEAAEAPVRPLQPERRGAIPLSAREVEVVSLIAQGLSNREIANRLILSVRTVERHIENVYNRLGISGKAGRAIVTAYALRHELVAPA